MARLPTKGTLLLHGRGIAVYQVAAQLDTSSASVSHWLRGFHRAPERLYTAVTLLADQETADDLRRIIEGAEVTK
ncbi:hypothetical protein BH18ACT6_BH18ACT6_07570 [soil metagenome]